MFYLSGAIIKPDYDRLQARTVELKKIFEDSERKLKILGKSKDAVDSKLKEAHIELAALKVSCDEGVEREKTLQEELDKSSEGFPDLDSDLLGNCFLKIRHPLFRIIQMY